MKRTTKRASKAEVEVMVAMIARVAEEGIEIAIREAAPTSAEETRKVLDAVAQGIAAADVPIETARAAVRLALVRSAEKRGIDLSGYATALFA